MAAFCTPQDGLDYIAGLRLNPSDTSLESNNLTSEANDIATELREIFDSFGYSEPSDTAQLLLAKLLNALELAQKQMRIRAEVIEPQLLSIYKQQIAFTLNDITLLKHGKFFPVFRPSSVGYVSLPTIRPTLRTINFTGIGDNTLTSSGDYTAKDSATFTVEIVTATTFKWKKNSGSFSAPITITGSNQTLSDGVNITIAAGSHIAGDNWVITITSFATIAKLQYLLPNWIPDGKNDVSTATANGWLDQRVVVVYSIAANLGYPLQNLSEKQARVYGQIISYFVAAFILQAKAFQLRRQQADVGALAYMTEALELLNNLRIGKYNQTFIG